MDINFSKFKLQWPRATYQGIDMIKVIDHAQSQSRQSRLAFDGRIQPKADKTTVTVILAICDRSCYTLSTKLLAVNIAEACYELIDPRDSKQLLLLTVTSVMISSKLYEQMVFGFESIHFLTNHLFTNPTLQQWEIKLLDFLEFELFENPRFVYQTHMLEYLYIIRSMFSETKFPFFQRTAELLFEVFLSNIEMIKEPINDDLLSLSIIQSALVILTQHRGRFPLTWRLQNLTLVEEDQINSLSSKILKICVTKEFLDKLNMG
jgi:hypothetical protein